MITGTVLFCLLLKLSHQFQHEDDDNSGIIFEQFQKINIFYETFEITYAIDISIIEKLKSSIHTMPKECPNDTHLTTRISALLPNKNTKWYQNTDKIAKNSEPEMFYQLERLKGATEYYMKNKESQEKCKFLNAILSYLRNIDTHFDRLSHADLTTLGEVISIDRLKNDIQSYIKKNENITLLFDFSYKFLTDFISNSKFAIYKNKDIHISFEIPVYNPYTLYSIYPKPIINNLNAFQLKLSSQYSTMNEDKYTLFTDEQLENLCFESDEKTFCNNTTNATTHS